MSLCAVGAGGLLSSPAFSHVANGDLAGFGLAAAGGTYLGSRFLSPWREQNILKSKVALSLKSATPEGDGLLMGYRTDTGEAVRITDEELMRHVMISGQSGMGKTVLLKTLMFQQIQRGGGLIFIDGKMNNDDIQTIYQYCVLCGREQDFKTLNPGNPAMSHEYNAILRGDPDEIAARILSLIPSTANNPGADHYRQSANQGITTLVAALQEAGLAFNFIDLTILLMNDKALSELETRLKRTRPNADATKSLSLMLDQYKGVKLPGGFVDMNKVDVKRLKEMFGGIGGRLFQFGTGKFGQVLNTYTPDIDIFDAIKKNQIVHVALPTMGKNEAAKSMGQMFLGDLRTAISWVQALPEHEKPRIPFLVGMDELGSYSTDSLARPFEQARSARIALMPAFQTWANLEAVSKEFAEMVIGNCTTKIFFRLGSNATAEEASLLMGDQISVGRTITNNKSRQESSPLLTIAPDGGTGSGEGATEAQKEEESRIVSPEELKALDKGECVMLYGGDAIFDLRVPMLEVDEKTQREIGKVRIMRQRKTPVPGADYFKNVDRYIGTSMRASAELPNE